MRLFNSIQLTVLFCIYPFICQWVKSTSFYAHNILFWILVIGYVLSFIGMAYAVYEALERDRS